MDQATRARRAEISRRLKAARWLRGGLDEKGRPAPLSPEDLADHEPLRRNGITANAISEIERMVKSARPMELRELCEALEMPPDWFAVESNALSREALQRSAALLAPQLLAAAQALRQAQEQGPQGTDRQDHRAASGEGADR